MRQVRDPVTGKWDCHQMKVYRLQEKPGTVFLTWQRVRVGKVYPNATDARREGDATGLPYEDVFAHKLVLNLDAILEPAEESRLRLGGVKYVVTYKWAAHRKGTLARRIALGLARVACVKPRRLEFVRRLGSITVKQWKNLGALDLFGQVKVAALPTQPGRPVVEG